MLVLRRHWFNIFVQFVPVLILALAIFWSYFNLPDIFPIFNEHAWRGFFNFFESLLAMFLLVSFFLVFIDYYLDAWIITDKRIVNIEQRGLFYRIISELELDKIQDITTEVSGVIPTFFNYGNVFIQTAAEKERFIFRKIPDPYKVKDVLMGLQKEIEKEKATDFRHLING